jgi:RNA polymerase sigma factor (sigma-70 family)
MICTIDPLQHEGLVRDIARRFVRRGLDEEDLVQEGFLGLLAAVRYFDRTRKVRFSSFATHCIRNRIKIALRDQSRTIRLTGWGWTTFFNADRDFASASSAKTLEHVLATRCQALGLAVVFLADDRDSPFEQASKREVLADLRNRVADLMPRDRDVLALYFGLDGPQLTLRQIAVQQGFSYQRAFQLVTRGLARLRRGLRQHAA